MLPARGGRQAFWVFEFPEWFIADWLDPHETRYRARPLIHQRRLVAGKFEAPDGGKRPVVAVRFVQGCGTAM